MSDVVKCPFVYANGKSCCGVVYRARAYGPSSPSRTPTRQDVRKYRLWCSERDDHAGVASDLSTKLRMEFYPDELAAGVEDLLWSGSLLS